MSINYDPKLQDFLKALWRSAGFEELLEVTVTCRCHLGKTPLHATIPGDTKAICLHQLLRRLALVICAAGLCLPHASAEPSLPPPHFSVPSGTISPNGRYGVMVQDSYGHAPNKLVDMKTGRVLADLAGEPGWTGNPSMRWGDMVAKWSADGSTLCWIFPGKWFLESFVLLKMQGSGVAWQVELMHAADREILARTENAAPLNFAMTKLSNRMDGSVYPEGFAIDVSQPPEQFSLPLVCKVSLTSNSKESEDEPEENGVRAWLTMTVGTDGGLSFSDFEVKKGALSPDAVQKVKANAVSVPLVDADIGKAMLFPGLRSPDGRYAVGWMVQSAQPGKPPVDWSHWNPADPDKLLRLYDWQRYASMAGAILPYKAVDLILDTHTRQTVGLPTDEPNWPGKRDGWEMTARWYTAASGRRYALIENGQKYCFPTANVWLADLGSEQIKVRDLTTPMRKAVDGLLRDRRPEIAAGDFFVSYPLLSGEEVTIKDGVADVPFVARSPSSDQKEFQLHGTVRIQLTDGTVAGVSSDQKRLAPFMTNEALKKADETLNEMFQNALRSAAPEDAQALKQKEREWIIQRDADASQAVNILPDDATQQSCEDARERSLLQSTNKRIEELKSLVR